MEKRCEGEPTENLQALQMWGAESRYWFGHTPAISAPLPALPGEAQIVHFPLPCVNYSVGGITKPFLSMAGQDLFLQFDPV